jgi:hypothetical protein
VNNERKRAKGRPPAAQGAGFARSAGICIVTAACALVGTLPQAAALPPNKAKQAQQHAPAAPVEPFGKIPKGPVQIIISTDQQKLHLYSDGSPVTETLIATGVPAHPTPLGLFTVVQKSLLHHSNIYSGAPMPFMQRITWSGVALHEGVNLGHPASHGCIRMPHDFATRLWVLTRLGARVIIARPELRPEDIADPHLFKHVENAVPEAKAVQTAQPSNEVKTPDAADAAKDAGKDAGKDATPAKLEVAADSQPAKSVKSGAVTASAEIATPNSAPPAKPVAPAATASKTPISVFVSRKTQRLYVRQDFLPVFDAAVTIDQPDQRIGTHVFTALEYLPDHSTFRWNVVSLPGDRTVQRPAAAKGTAVKPKLGDDHAAAVDAPPAQTPQQALARIAIPQDAIDRISQLIGPGFSLIISDEGLGEETGEGTDFVVVTPVVQPERIVDNRGVGRQARRPYDDGPYGGEAPMYPPGYRTYYSTYYYQRW